MLYWLLADWRVLLLLSKRVLGIEFIRLLVRRIRFFISRVSWGFRRIFVLGRGVYSFILFFWFFLFVCFFSGDCCLSTGLVGYGLHRLRWLTLLAYRTDKEQSFEDKVNKVRELLKNDWVRDYKGMCAWYSIEWICSGSCTFLLHAIAAYGHGETVISVRYTVQNMIIIRTPTLYPPLFIAKECREARPKLWNPALMLQL